MEKLKPCPFCGGEASIKLTSTAYDMNRYISKCFLIMCDRCEMRFGVFHLKATLFDDGTFEFDTSERDTVIKAWNRRANEKEEQ